MALVLASAGSISAFAIAAPAQAVVQVATYSGTLRFGSYDQSGVFGAAGTSLNGLAYGATYKYDTDLASRTTVPGVSDKVFGGPYYGTPTSPILDTTVTINVSPYILGPTTAATPEHTATS